MYAIETGGPVSVSMTCSTSFMNYGGGVYQKVSDCGVYLSSVPLLEFHTCRSKVDEGGGGHAVVLVGWGTSDTGTPYWIGQNSWFERTHP